ncbi:M17 family metallopeptidase [Nocardioides sp.]|uniref:leucyl aminopeptidase family protein n=1 Tax=Nocardioides sp. TaxID=35761 RepID=UPI002735D096|nr:leucyl aminopeptidase family protein [Nocardioides sp.]MDP3893525.1 leucyl aminopeptidase family protein [Nocardioides sp.]
MTPTDTPTLPAQVSAPEISLSDLPAHLVPDVEVVALPVLPAEYDDGGVMLGPGAEQALGALGAGGVPVDGLGLLELAGATGRAGETTVHQLPGSPVPWLVLVGIGGGSVADFRRAGAALARASVDRGVVATSLTALAPPGGTEAFVVGATLGAFGFHWRSSGPERQPVASIVLAGRGTGSDPASGPASDTASDELRTGLAKGRAAWRSRFLATVPSNLKNPAWLVEQATRAAEEAGLEVDVWDESRLARDGFGGILAVGRASATPPRLIRLDYTPPRVGRRTPRVVLVGKGITFDSGGLSIKPGEGMMTMKRDMTGGGVVIATMAALAAVGCPVRVTGLVAAAENAVSGNALRPGDVIRHYGGRTSEVTNTDAEGRLVLADAIAYATRELEPAAIVDIATLTGAMKVALGQRTGGFFANHDGLAEAVAAAAETSGEPLWRLPLEAAYEEKLSSKVADADNAAGSPGAITAALFLQHFVDGLPWAHLDVASVGDSPSESFEWSAGPTGFGSRVLLEWLGSAAPLASLEKP